MTTSQKQIVQGIPCSCAGALVGGKHERAFFTSHSGNLLGWNTSSKWSISACLLVASHTWEALFCMHLIIPVKTLGWWWELPKVLAVCPSTLTSMQPRAVQLSTGEEPVTTE